MTERSLPRWRMMGSPLTRRILTVNLLAPVVLVVGLLYLDYYRQGLIRAELEGLATQGRMMAAAVAESSVFEGDSGFMEINHEPAQQMIRRLAEPTGLRVRLFGSVGELAADSRTRKGGTGNVHVKELPVAHVPRWSDRLRQWWEGATRWLPIDDSVPVYHDLPHPRAGDYDEVVTAMTGRADWAVRTRKSGGLVLSVAVPVQHYKQVVGVLFITSDATGVARSLFQVRIALLMAFGLSLVLTVAVSLYLAGTIARPVRRLALAAERVRRGHGRVHSIPDLSARRDEIGELSVALKEMTEALWRRMDAIEAFAADVAHEIKNPLTSLRSAVETAARLENPAQQRKLMAIILDDVGRLNRLITDISDASRIDAEMQRMETEPVSMGAMIETLAEVYRSSADEDGPQFEVVRPEGDGLTVMGLESRLVQVLRNLIANAISFSPRNGVITLAARRHGDVIRVTVTDQGPGIPPNTLDVIFERFYSERPPGEKFGTHSGLGLSISRQIADAHGGRLFAANREEGGACFTLDLPAA